MCRAGNLSAKTNFCTFLKKIDKVYITLRNNSKKACLHDTNRLYYVYYSLSLSIEIALKLGKGETIVTFSFEALFERIVVEFILVDIVND